MITYDDTDDKYILLSFVKTLNQTYTCQLFSDSKAVRFLSWEYQDFRRQHDHIRRHIRRLTKTPEDLERRSEYFSPQENDFAPVSYLIKSDISEKESSIFILFFMDFSVIAHIFRPEKICPYA